ncbi:YqiA/YcfP family alpha/beta fold hydrolase [Parachitinimonas caeni]|uniref:YqiA/YcfP family alpha/beta fold hydrolase n=1 Tax=Parachitinimonas caeni TaxID=3031301 RepID=A0ABT7DRN4_9NEIS|nr:YqiA/YcfP family alpha/beta fold hydrolase [Parachitinimonas caeni]MDK2122732.1 YqiA/YcfP family alpha/beta fold hydrolase [Parachitinimonas caeni]
MYIVYLHGFNSSPASVKARQTQAFLNAHGLGDRFVCPTLPAMPDEAEAAIIKAVHGLPEVGFIGSSLGGFHATWAAERFGSKAVLVNPGVKPQHLLRDYLGWQQNLYSGERYFLDDSHVAAFARLEPPTFTAGRYWLMVQTADETLDYRQAVDYYAGARQTVEAGGSHSFEHFERHLPEICAFLGLPLPVAPTN